MRNFNELTITDAVLERLANTADPRLKQISEALVRHLHAFIREIRPTQAEWSRAIDFLTATGHMCSGSRQEFILLSDTLGASMLVDAINHAPAENVTESTVVGPFYVSSPPEFPLGADISGALKGEPVFVSGTVRAPDGSVIPNATVDVWHSDDDGYYDVQKLSELAGRARFHAGHVCAPGADNVPPRGRRHPVGLADRIDSTDPSPAQCRLRGRLKRPSTAAPLGVDAASARCCDHAIRNPLIATIRPTRQIASCDTRIASVFVSRLDEHSRAETT